METRILVLESTLKEKELQRELTRWRDCAERRLKRERYLQGELYLRCEQLRAAYEELERQEKKIKIAKEILEEK